MTNDEIQAAAAAAMARGESTATGSMPVAVDYFGFEETKQCFLPDGVSFIEHKVLNEEGRRLYLNKVNREIAISRRTGDAHMKVQSGDDKHALLKSAICGWNLQRLNPETGLMTPVLFHDREVNLFLSKSNPKIIDIIEKDIRKNNPWLMVDLSADDIREQIADLEEMLKVKLEEDEGKDS